MHVRPKRHPTKSRRAAVLRRPRPSTRDDPSAEPAAQASAARFEDDLADERRLRAAGGPDDRAQYSCTCGYVFQADVSTSVACPQCGTGQAW